MTYKEALFFIAKCLTINREQKNKNLIEEDLKSNKVNWDSVVKLSTSHFVFPALYCNLKKACFLHYLPKDLVEYMKHITGLNKERNQQIITQAKEVNNLLLKNNVTPIFLKGTGNLLEGLYDDVAERMVGDIDLIIKNSDVEKADQILRKHLYYSDSILLKNHRHLPRLIHKDKIGAIEIHKHIVIEKYRKDFNFNILSENSIVKNNIVIPSYKNQLNTAIIAKQINDSGQYYKNISLRNAYDVFLLSKKTNAKNAFDTLEKLKTPLNCFLAICYEVFNKPKSLEYIKNSETESYLKVFYNHLTNDNSRKNHQNKTKRKLFVKKRLQIVSKSIIDKNHRNWLIKRLTDKDWQEKKLIQYKLKKPKPNS